MLQISTTINLIIDIDDGRHYWNECFDISVQNLHYEFYLFKPLKCSTAEMSLIDAWFSEN